MSEWTFRGALPEDANLFADWVRNNPQIDPGDVQRTIQGNNPTCVTFVACLDGKPVAFVPVYAVAMIAHLGFDLDARASAKMQAMPVLLDGITSFFIQYGIRELAVLTREDYGIAKWAAAHGFEKDGRELFRLDINKLLPPADVTSTK